MQLAQMRLRALQAALRARCAEPIATGDIITIPSGLDGPPDEIDWVVAAVGAGGARYLLTPVSDISSGGYDGIDLGITEVGPLTADVAARIEVDVRQLVGLKRIGTLSFEQLQRICAAVASGRN